ncbi:hypothetical protein [Bdellovibrio sp. HCB288]|uniref:hypothetical protein n=1 Tax=Bdellovibrio sp. HCB288 TaxID=3394355 RepID=UPI0039B3A8CF
MTLIQFLTRVREKIGQTSMPDTLSETGLVLRSDRRVAFGHVDFCLQIANHKGTKFWAPPSEQFKRSWIQLLPILKKHDPTFFEEFKDDSEARAELKEILGA